MDVNEIISELRRSIKPYQEEFDTYARLPEVGRCAEEIIAEMEDFYAREEHKWRDGYVSGAVYHGEQEHIAFLNQVYALQSQNNPLHLDVWPSGSKFEAEIVAMTADMLGADETDDEIVGTVSSGGTESILLAMKAYRDRARSRDGVTEPNIVTTTTAHAAFDKAAQYFEIELRGSRWPRTAAPTSPRWRPRSTPTRSRWSARRRASRTAWSIRSRSFRAGVALSAASASTPTPASAASSCRGPRSSATTCRPFDFRLPGVTSMSCDTHKYGYAAKGTSVVLYRDNEPAPQPVLHGDRLAGRALRLADLRRQPARRA